MTLLYFFKLHICNMERKKDDVTNLLSCDITSEMGFGVTFHGRNCNRTRNVGKLSKCEKTNDKWSISSW